MNSGVARPDLLRAGTFMFEVNRLAQRLNNLILFGRIFEADYEKGKVRVRVTVPGVADPIETDWIPWMTLRAGKNRTWIAPEVEEQVMIVSPNGNMVNAVCIMGLNWTDYIHEAKSPDMEKEVWIDHESAYLEFNRENWTRRFFINEGGTFAWNIGTKSNIVMDKNHIELRVGTTKLVVRDGAMSAHINGEASEWFMTPEKFLAHVQEKGIFEITREQVKTTVEEKGVHTVTAERVESRVNDKGIHSVEETEIQSSVDGKGVHKVLADMVEAAIEKNGYHRVKRDSVESGLVEQMVRQIITPEAIKSMVQTAIMELMGVTAKVSVPGSSIDWTPAAIIATSPAFQGVQSAAPPVPFVPGQAPEFTAPEDVEDTAIPDAPASVALPEHTTGNKPSYPRGDKMASS